MNHEIRSRELLSMGATAAAFSLLPNTPVFCADSHKHKPKFRLSACDWSLGKRSDLSAFELASQIGLDGVEISFGKPGEENDLRKQKVRQQYLKASKKHGIEISSAAMGFLNQLPFASHPKTEQWVADCLEIMPKLNLKVLLLAFFGKGDIKEKPKLQAEVIRRLKRLAPVAEKSGLQLGIESWLSADELTRIIDAVGSPAIKVYYDVANTTKMGYDIHKEIRQLGRDTICQFHAKENGFLLGKGKVDFKRVKESIDAIGWNGWITLEGATDRKLGVLKSYIHNQNYLRKVFAI